MALQIILGIIGLVLLITGTLPFRDGTLLFKPLYGRILGLACIVFLILLRVFLTHGNTTAIIISGIGLIITTIVCIFPSIDEPVR